MGSRQSQEKAKKSEQNLKKVENIVEIEKDNMPLKLYNCILGLSDGMVDPKLIMQLFDPDTRINLIANSRDPLVTDY